jgi:hypothetical protein
MRIDDSTYTTLEGEGWALHGARPPVTFTINQRSYLVERYDEDE